MAGFGRFPRNVRAEAYWRLRQWMRIGADLVPDERWKQLLTLKYRRELSGKLKIMGKREMQKLGLKSPDAPDALMLTFITEIKAFAPGVVVPSRRKTSTGIVRSRSSKAAPVILSA